LKLVAAQDVGGRDQDLLDSVIIDDHESAELVASVLTDALTGAQGAQVIVDQGTPYMARITDGIGQSFPRLRDTALAQAAARLVVISILRAYQFGARAATRAIEARGAVDPDELARRAADHRNEARATEISARLLLGHVHDLYDTATLSQLQPSSQVAPCDSVNASAILGDNRPKQRPPPSVALRN
jgi:hypothetical protein